MKVIMLGVLCLIFLVFSLFVNETMAEFIKTIVVWGSFLFLVLVLIEIWKLRFGAEKSNKWDEDP